LHQRHAFGFRPYGARADVEYHDGGVRQTVRTLFNAKGVADVVTGMTVLNLGWCLGRQGRCVDGKRRYAGWVGTV